MTQNVGVPARLSTENLGKFTSELTLVTQEFKPAKNVRGSVMVPKGKADSHWSGSQKQHHQHPVETLQVGKGSLGRGLGPFLLLLGILQLGQHPLPLWLSFPGDCCPCASPSGMSVQSSGTQLDAREVKVKKTRSHAQAALTEEDDHTYKLSEIK